MELLAAHSLAVLWLVLLIVTILAEAASQALVSIWFMPGALIAAILAYFGVPFAVQLVVFLVLSGSLLVCTRPLAAKLMKKKTVATNADRVIGQKATVTAEIPAGGGVGQVRVLGQYWSAQAAEETDSFPTGAPVRVQRMEGVRLIVVPYQENSGNNDTV